MSISNIYSLLVPQNQYRYWYSRLSFRHKQQYDELIHGLFSYSDVITYYGTKSELRQLIIAMRKDIPELFFVSRHYKCYEISPTVLYYYPQYRFSCEETYRRYHETMMRCMDFIQKAGSETDVKKKRDLLYEFLTGNVEYNAPKKARSHEFYYVLAKGTGVCEGIAKAAKFLSDRIGLKTIVIFGKGISTGHAWNVVNTGNQSSHMDATYGISSGDKIFYKDMTTEQAHASGHKWNCTLPADCK